MKLKIEDFDFLRDHKYYNLINFKNVPEFLLLPGCIHHSDRGAQCASADYVKELTRTCRLSRLDRQCRGQPAGLHRPDHYDGCQNIAATIVDLLTETEAMKKIQDEFVDRTGGGIGGAKWIPPLLPRDFEAPVNYPWPEYIKTARGEDWLTPHSEDY